MFISEKMQESLSLSYSDMRKICREYILHESYALRTKKKYFFGPSPGKNWNNPKQSGWLLVIPDDNEGDDILEALQPLLTLRSPEPECKSPHIVRFPTSTMHIIEMGEWIRNFIMDHKSNEPHPPGYVLLAGSLSSLPYTLQHSIATYQTVGRLSFDNISDYRTYAEKVVFWETKGNNIWLPPKQNPVVLFGTNHGSNDVTWYSSRYIMKPFAERLSAVEQTYISLWREHATLNNLIHTLSGGGDNPLPARILFSATHGLAIRGPEASESEKRRAMQGAIVCQDGFNNESEIFSAASLTMGTPVLPGGIAILFACFGGGTPAQSDFPLLGSLQSYQDCYRGAPFVAALPKAMLAKSNGPLGIIAHLDPSFIHTFTNPDVPEGSRNFVLYSVLEYLLNGHRLGPSMKTMLETRYGLGNELQSLKQLLLNENIWDESNNLTDKEWTSRQRLINAAISFYNYRNFVILGDPAVHIPSA